MANYKIQCEKCKKYFLKKDMILKFSYRRCKVCATMKTIQSNNNVTLPLFLMEKYGLKVRDKVKLVPLPDGILIKKNV